MEQFQEIATATLKRWVSADRGRIGSWKQCFDAFKPGREANKEILALRLAFFLASYGMYRGSSALLKHDHRILFPIVDYLISVSDKIYGISIGKLDAEVDIIKTLYGDIKEINISTLNEVDDVVFCDEKMIPSDTLVTKIIFGSLCSIPAFDKYVNIALNKFNMKSNSNRIAGRYHVLVDIFGPLDDKIKAVNEGVGCCNWPDMLIIDAYLWQIGYNYSRVPAPDARAT